MAVLLINGFSTVFCSYNGQDSGKVGLYVAGDVITKEKNYFEVEILDSGLLGTIGLLALCAV
jgi:hypothetical protein